MIKKVSVVIPNYNGKIFLGKCLKSLKAACCIEEIIVIDNGSNDGSLEFIKQNYSYVKTIKNTTNRGFSGAVNQGIREAVSEYVYLLNNDTEVENDFLLKPLEIMDDPSVFSVNSLMIKFYNRALIDGAGDALTLLSWPYRQLRDKERELAATVECFSGCAGATLYRKSMLLEVGLFDEIFFAYLEDVDLGFRAQLYGFKNYLCSESVVYHIEHGTSGKGKNEFKTKLSAQNSIYMVYKNYSNWGIFVNSPFLLFGHLIKYVHFRILGLDQAYVEGIKEASFNIQNISRCSKRTFFSKRWFKIQYQLFLYTIVYIGGRLIRKKTL